jgi:hypothetical protein
MDLLLVTIFFEDKDNEGVPADWRAALYAHTPADLFEKQV